MKTLLYLTLGALLACPTLTYAQSTNAPSGPPPGGGHHRMDFLTADQKAELQKDREAVFTANPDLASQIKSVHDQMREAHDSGQPPSQDLFEQAKSLQDQLDQAIIKIDPAAASIIAEIKAHRPHHGPGEGGPEGQGGPGGNTPPPPDSGT